MNRIKLLFKAIHALARISDNLQSLNETLIAQSMVSKDKPAMFVEDVDTMNPAKVKSPLLRAYLRTRQYSQFHGASITHYDVAKAESMEAEKVRAKLFKPWTDVENL